MGDLIRPIPNSIIDVRKSLSKDLMTRYRDSLTLIEALIKSAPLMEGAVDSVSSGTITDTNPTYGSIQHNDQFNGLELHFTSGAVYTANNHNRFKITATNFTNKTITVAENLVTAGVVATDTYEILGHSHDGTATGGARIDLKNLANILRGQLMTQDLADAITDPSGVRGGPANAANPFVTAAAVVGAQASAVFVTGVSPLVIPHALGIVPTSMIFHIHRYAVAAGMITNYVSHWIAGAQTWLAVQHGPGGTTYTRGTGVFVDGTIADLGGSVISPGDVKVSSVSAANVTLTFPGIGTNRFTGTVILR